MMMAEGRAGGGEEGAGAQGGGHGGEAEEGVGGGGVPEADERLPRGEPG